MGEKYPANTNASYLTINSQDDVNAIAPNFNPADFSIQVPNSTRLQEVIRLCITHASVPRMFENVTLGNNTLFFWQRQVIEIPFPELGPGWVLRTVNPEWVPVNSVQIRRGIQNLDAILTVLNANTPYIWSYIPPGPPLSYTAGGSVQIVTQPPFTTYVFGPFYDPGWTPPTGPPVYANMTIVTSYTAYTPDLEIGTRSPFFNGLGAMGILGLRAYQEDVKTTAHINQQVFDSLNSSTFGAVNGVLAPGDVQLAQYPSGMYPSPIYRAARLPLYDQLATYATWSTAAYTTPELLSPDLSGPSIIYVSISDLGDGTTTYTHTGTNYDIITTVNISDTPWGENGFKEVHDGEFEGIGLRQPRNITSLRVRLLGSQMQQLYLPANFKVNLRAQVLFVAR